MDIYPFLPFSEFLIQSLHTIWLEWFKDRWRYKNTCLENYIFSSYVKMRNRYRVSILHTLPKFHKFSPNDSNLGKQLGLRTDNLNVSCSFNITTVHESYKNWKMELQSGKENSYY